MVGEVQSSTRSSAGHEYLTLRDADSTLECVRFRSSIRPDEEVPPAGEVVLVVGRVDLYAPRSRYQMVVNALFRPGGIGLLSKELEALKRRLQAEGLFDAARKRPIPVAPQGIALVTSRTGAVLHDVLRVLRHGAPQARLVLIHSAVQGATAPAEIVEAIGRANDLARSEARTGRGDAPSVILLARGGGSSDDLAAFNNEAVLRAIAGSELPVLSAVGHESDATLADLVADDRAGTPSIGAARLASNLDALRRAPLELAARARGAAVASIARAAAAFDGERRALAAASPVASLERAQERLALVADDLSRAVRGRLRLDDLQVERAATLLSALSPFGVLARGYAMVEGGDGRLVRSWRQVAVGGTIRVRLEDGELGAEVTRSGKGSRDGN